MTYKAKGKRSKAWWLQAIKWFGKDGTRGIVQGAEVPSYQIREVIQDLATAQVGMVEIQGKSGKGLRPKYYLTSAGHKYLADNADDVDEPLPDDKPVTPVIDKAITLGQEIERHNSGAAQSNIQHSVPSHPEFPGPRLNTPDPAAVQPAVNPTPKEKIVRHADSGLKTPLNTPEKPEKTPIKPAAVANITIKIQTETVDVPDDEDVNKLDITKIQEALAAGARLFEVLAVPEIDQLIFVMGKLED